MTSSHPCARCGAMAWGVLCRTCYDGIKPGIEHGTQLMYRKGCKCQPCVSGATRRRNERKKRQAIREKSNPQRTTTITVTWGDVTQEHALDISRRVAREITKFTGVEDAHVKDPVRVANGRKGGLLGGGKGHHRLKALSERGTNNPLTKARGSAEGGQPDRPATKPDRNPRSERASGNGDLDLLKIPSFKARGKGKSLIEVVSQLTERS